MKWPFVSRREYQRALAERNEADRCLASAQARLSKMEEALSAFWADRDNWDFDSQGVPDTWYPVGAFAEAVVAGERR